VVFLQRLFAQVEISWGDSGVLMNLKLAHHTNNLISCIVTVSRARNTIYG